MPADRKQVAEALREIARLSELKGENPFKCRAFEQAARTIERTAGELEDLVGSGALTEIRGIGKATAEQITSLVREDRSPLLEELRAAFPEGLRRLLEVPGLGPKRLRVIHEKLAVTSLGELEYAIHENRLRDLPGFGPKSQESLLEAVVAMRRHEGRFLLPAAWTAVEEIFALRENRGERVEIAGELRRQIETLSELLLLIEGAAGSPPSEERTPAGNGMPVRLLHRSQESFEACWLWESCSADHRASLQERAAARGLTFDGDGLGRGRERLPLAEKAVYETLGLEPVHPLLREGDPEKAPHPAALAGPESIRGIFHVHTTDSDGVGTITQMVAEAQRLGYRWIGISDHSKTAFYANGLGPERLREQRRSIEEVRPRHPKMHIFHGIESDILGDGSLDYEDALLLELDFVVASVHSQFRMDRRTMTDRIERALRHPATTHWGHPTGRLLLGREGYDCDIEHLLKVCAEEGVSVEFNANPHRLDLDWRWIGRALELGIPISVNPDAHTLEGLSDARLTVGTAAKGGLTPQECLNSRTAEEIATWLIATRNKTR